MELTPQAVSEAEFREAKRGGYNIRDVDEFLDRVAVGVAQMQERIREAYQRAEAAENRVVDLQRQVEEAQRRGVDPSGSDAEDTLRRTLVLAQRTADATIKDAKEEAERLVSEAQEEAASTRAAAEAEVREGVAKARREAEDEVQELVATRDDLVGEVRLLEEHVNAQRDQLRANVEELQRVLDDPSSLRVEEPPPLSDVPDLQRNGSVSPVPSSPVPPPPGAAGGPPPDPPDASETGDESSHGDPSIGEPGALDGAPPSDRPPSPDRPPLPNREPLRRSELGTAPPRSSTDPEPEPSAFRPEMSFDPSEERGPRQGAPGHDAPAGDDDLSLPIDAPPPPPPPPGLDHLRDVGGIPIEPGSRPSEWGKAIFDTEEDDEPSSSRFGRRG